MHHQQCRVERRQRHALLWSPYCHTSTSWPQYLECEERTPGKGRGGEGRGGEGRGGEGRGGEGRGGEGRGGEGRGGEGRGGEGRGGEGRGGEGRGEEKGQIGKFMDKLML